jgi:hypothetical protein
LYEARPVWALRRQFAALQDIQDEQAGTAIATDRSKHALRAKIVIRQC